MFFRSSSCSISTFISIIAIIIYLYSNSIGNEGAIAISESLKLNHSIININLDDNNIGNEGVIAISEALKHNHTITEIDLSENYNIGNEGAIAISEGLKHNHTITNINLGSNKIDDQRTMNLIDDQLNRNKQIPYVMCSYCCDLFVYFCYLLSFLPHLFLTSLLYYY